MTYPSAHQPPPNLVTARADLCDLQHRLAVVCQFNPPDEITYERRKLKAMYRVVPMNELLGV